MKTAKAISPQIGVVVHSEDIPVRGNAMASGDDDLDKKVEDEIIRKLEAGDVWAWCTVEVKATLLGLEASEYLGCCSYEDLDDFKQGGYYEDMVQTACEELNRQLLELQNVELVFPA